MRAAQRTLVCTSRRAIKSCKSHRALHTQICRVVPKLRHHAPDLSSNKPRSAEGAPVTRPPQTYGQRDKCRKAATQAMREREGKKRGQREIRRYLHMILYKFHLYTYIYIYTHRERQRERARDRLRARCPPHPGLVSSRSGAGVSRSESGLPELGAEESQLLCIGLI